MREHGRQDDGHAPDVLRAEHGQQGGRVQEQHVHEHWPLAGGARVPDYQRGGGREQNRASHQRADPVSGAVILLGKGHQEHEHEHERPWQQEQDRDVDRHMRCPRACGECHRDWVLPVRLFLRLRLLRQLLLRGEMGGRNAALFALAPHHLVAEHFVIEQVYTHIERLHFVCAWKYSESMCLFFYVLLVNQVRMADHEALSHSLYWQTIPQASHDPTGLLGGVQLHDQLGVLLGDLAPADGMCALRAVRVHALRVQGL